MKQQLVPMTFFSATEPNPETGRYVLARLQVPQAGVPDAYLIYDPASGQLGLHATCGCSVHVHLGAMVQRLAETMRRGHGDAEQRVEAACSLH